MAPDPPKSSDSEAREDKVSLPFPEDDLDAEETLDASVDPFTGEANSNRTRDDLPSDPADESTPRSPLLKLGTKLERYRLVEKLGEGAMGIVYRAEDESLSRDVALKVLAPEMARDPEVVDRFHREARAAAAITHPNLVPIFSIGEARGVHYYAMDFVPGKNLARVLKENGRLPFPTALRYTLQAAQGLRAAQSKGVLHRDVKPANLVIDAEDEVRVVDFGLAKFKTEASMTQTGIILGTPNYMSPEQARGLEIDFRADIYSLGACLYHLVVGEPMYGAASAMGVCLKHMNDPIPDIGGARDVPADFQLIFQEMVAKEAEDRYQTYEELILDLTEVLDEVDPNSTSSARLRAIRTKEGKTAGDSDLEREVLEDPPLLDHTPIHGVEVGDLDEVRQQLQEQGTDALKTVDASDEEDEAKQEEEEEERKKKLRELALQHGFLDDKPKETETEPSEEEAEREPSAPTKSKQRKQNKRAEAAEPVRAEKASSSKQTSERQRKALESSVGFAAELAPASATRRLAAFGIELVIGLGFVYALSLLGQPDILGILLFLLYYGATHSGEAGRGIGEILTGLARVPLGRTGPIGFLGGLSRGGILFGPILISATEGWIPYVQPVWLVPYLEQAWLLSAFTIASTLVGVDHRGLHDLLAGTITRRWKVSRPSDIPPPATKIAVRPVAALFYSILPGGGQLYTRAVGKFLIFASVLLGLFLYWIGIKGQTFAAFWELDNLFLLLGAGVYTLATFDAVVSARRHNAHLVPHTEGSLFREGGDLLVAVSLLVIALFGWNYGAIAQDLLDGYLDKLTSEPTATELLVQTLYEKRLELDKKALRRDTDLSPSSRAGRWRATKYRRERQRQKILKWVHWATESHPELEHDAFDNYARDLWGFAARSDLTDELCREHWSYIMELYGNGAPTLEAPPEEE